MMRYIMGRRASDPVDLVQYNVRVFLWDASHMGHRVGLQDGDRYCEVAHKSARERFLDQEIGL